MNTKKRDSDNIIRVLRDIVTEQEPRETLKGTGEDQVLRDMIIDATEQELREALKETGEDFDSLAAQGKALVEKAIVDSGYAPPIKKPNVFNKFVQSLQKLINIAVPVPSSTISIDEVAAARSRRAALGSFVGAVVDWYDFLLYGITAALVFNKQFFPSADPIVGTLAAFATLGVGFLFRPLGGVVFGHFGDRLGRKRMLVITVMMMGISTAMIGLLPTYSIIGWYAPLGLVILRAIQGLAVGGEWGGAALMAVESAPKGEKAFYSSGVQIGYGVALVLASGMVSLFSNNLSNDSFMTWGWRIPFLLSAVLVLIAVWIRNTMEEPLEFVEKVLVKKVTKPKIPMFEALRKHPKDFLFIIALRMAENFMMYIVTAFALTYSTKDIDMPRNLFLNITVLVGAISCVTIPFFAFLSDYFGRRRVYFIGALIGLLSSIPFFLAMEAGSVVGIIIFSLILVNIAHDMIVSVQQPLITEIFGTEYRYSGAGAGYQVAAAICGGFTPFIATALFGYGGTWWVAFYLAAGCLVSLGVSWFIKANDSFKKTDGVVRVN
jgi:MFS transporter, MHS family, shikimate and dehydroshikimate transport protein